MVALSHGKQKKNKKNKKNKTMMSTTKLRPDSWSLFHALSGVNTVHSMGKPLSQHLYTLARV